MRIQPRPSPSTGKKFFKNNIYAHVRLHYLLIRLSEYEIRDQDIEERLHFNQREALTYAGLRGSAFVKELVRE